MDKTQALKEKYKSQLAPFLNLLTERREQLREDHWYEHVKRTEDHVIKSPEQYLSGVLSRDNEVVAKIVRELFRELIDESRP